MKKLITLLFIGACSTLIALTSCSKDEGNEPLASLYQTQWEGTLARASSSEPIFFAFNDEESGVYTYEKGGIRFEYTQIDKIVRIKAPATYLSISGDWWIYKMTQSELELRLNPNAEYQATLNLKRIY